MSNWYCPSRRCLCCMIALPRGTFTRKQHFFSRTAASLESRASPKKADEGGGGGAPIFFRFQKGGGHGPDVPPSKSATVGDNGLSSLLNAHTRMFVCLLFVCLCTRLFESMLMFMLQCMTTKETLGNSFINTGIKWVAYQTWVILQLFSFDLTPHFKALHLHVSHNHNK